jgi:hypothetical protein
MMMSVTAMMARETPLVKQIEGSPSDRNTEIDRFD